MYTVINDSMKYLTEIKTSVGIGLCMRFGDETDAVEFETQGSAETYAWLACKQFGTEMAVLDMEQNGKVVTIYYEKGIN